MTFGQHAREMFTSTPVQPMPRGLWRLFSPPVIRALLSEAGADVVIRLLRDLGYPPKDWKGRGPDLSSVYADIFASLTARSATEYAYKNAIVQRVLYSKHSKPHSRVFFEFRTGASKLDALVLNQSLHAIEVKSELDDLTRLATQVAAYKSRFEHVWVFSSERNLLAVERSVANDVGLICLRENKRFSVERPATPDLSRINAQAMIEMLRRQEYISVLSRFGFSPEGLPNTKLFKEVMSFAEAVDPALLHEELRIALSARASSLPSRALRNVPFPLRGGVVPVLKSEMEVEFLLQNLRSRI